MVDHNSILMLITTVAIFFQGFSFRRNVPVMIISSLVILFVSGLSMILNGIGIYVNTLSNVDTYDVVVSLAYVLFLWGCGYVIGGAVSKKFLVI